MSSTVDTKIKIGKLELKNPVLTKALRLSYEHLEENNAFLIEIPNDDPIDDNLETENSKYLFQYITSNSSKITILIWVLKSDLFPQ